MNFPISAKTDQHNRLFTILLFMLIVSVDLLHKSFLLIVVDATNEFNSLCMFLSSVSVAFRQYAEHLNSANHMFYHNALC